MVLPVKLHTDQWYSTASSSSASPASRDFFYTCMFFSLINFVLPRATLHVHDELFYRIFFILPYVNYVADLVGFFSICFKELCCGRRKILHIFINLRYIYIYIIYIIFLYFSLFYVSSNIWLEYVLRSSSLEHESFSTLFREFTPGWIPLIYRRILAR